jgi:hypothetical protein
VEIFNLPRWDRPVYTRTTLNSAPQGHASRVDMSGLEVLGALSAVLSVLSSATDFIEKIQERKEIEHHVHRARDVLDLLQWQWTDLSEHLEAARLEGLDNRQMTEHAMTLEKKLREAFDLVKDLMNRDRTANIKMLLGFGAGKLQRLNSCLDHLVIRQQTLESIYIRFVLVYSCLKSS